MQVHVKLLVICQSLIHRFELQQRVINEAARLNVAVVLSAPCRHVSERAVLFISAELLYLCCLFLITKNGVPRVTVSDDRTCEEIFEYVVAHHNFPGKVIREEQMARLYEVVLRVVYGRKLALHAAAEGLPWCSVPGLKIFLPLAPYYI